MKILISYVILQATVLANTCFWYSLKITPSNSQHSCFDVCRPCEPCLPQGTCTPTLALWGNNDKQIMRSTNNEVQTNITGGLQDNLFTCRVIGNEGMALCNLVYDYHMIMRPCLNQFNHYFIECKQVQERTCYQLSSQDQSNFCQSSAPGAEESTQASDSSPANDLNVFAIIGSVLGSLVVLILSVILAIQLIRILRRKRRHFHTFQGPSERDTNATFMYSGGEPSPYDMNGVGGDPLYAQLEEPEKPDTAHSGCRFGDNHFTTRQGERDEKAANMYTSPPLPGEPSPYECAVENGLYAQLEPDESYMIHSGCRTEDNYYIKPPAIPGENDEKTENMHSASLLGEPSPYECAVVNGLTSKGDPLYDEPKEVHSHESPARDEKEKLTVESKIYEHTTPQTELNSSGLSHESPAREEKEKVTVESAVYEHTTPQTELSSSSASHGSPVREEKEHTTPQTELSSSNASHGSPAREEKEHTTPQTELSSSSPEPVLVEMSQSSDNPTTCDRQSAPDDELTSDDTTDITVS